MTSLQPISGVNCQRNAGHTPESCFTHKSPKNSDSKELLENDRR